MTGTLRLLMRSHFITIPKPAMDKWKMISFSLIFIGLHSVRIETTATQSLSDTRDTAIRAVDSLSFILSRDSPQIRGVNIHKIQNGINSMTDQEQIHIITKSINFIAGAIGNFKNDDLRSLIFASMDIISGIKAVKPLVEPFSDSFFSLLSSILDLFASDGNRSVTMIIEDLMNENIDILEDSALQVALDEFCNMYNTSFSRLKNKDRQYLSEDEINSLVQDTALYNGVGFLEVLAEKIRESSSEEYLPNEEAAETRNSADMLRKAQKAIKYSNLYLKLAVLKDVVLNKVMSIVIASVHNNTIIRTVESIVETSYNKSRNVVRFLVEPAAQNAVTVSLFSQSREPYISAYLQYHSIEAQDLNYLSSTPRALRPLQWNSWHAVMDTGEDGWIRGSASQPKQDGLFILTQVSPDNHFTITSAQWPMWFVVMSDTPEGWLKGQLHPGEEGTWKVIQLTDGSYLLSPKRWPNWFAFMSDSDEGWVRGWKGYPGRQGQWLL